MLDPQIDEMRKQDMTAVQIAKQLSISKMTVLRRIKHHGWKVRVGEQSEPAGVFKPMQDEVHTLAVIACIVSDLRRKHGVKTRLVIDKVFDLASRGSLDIKRVALY
jgi:orotate phosphoribosyltransferase-like protein